MRNDLRQNRKVRVRSKRLTVERIVGDILLAIFLRTVVQLDRDHKMG